MNKQDIYQLLEEKGIWHEITEHPAVYNMEELSQVELPYPEADAKNLFVRDDKRQNFYLITVKGDKRVNLKQFRRDHGTKNLTFASPEDLMTRMALIPGAVSPLGLLNDGEKTIQFFLDKDFLDAPGLVGIHPNDNTATVWLKAEDLIRLVQEHGNPVEVTALA